MRSSKLWMLVAVILAGSVSVFAQTSPDLENGFKYYGSYDGSHLDTVNLMNGNLMLHLPLVPELPQRGNKLDLKYLVYLTSKTWTGSCHFNHCVPTWSFLGGGAT